VTLDLYCVLEIYETKIQVQFPRALPDWCDRCGACVDLTLRLDCLLADCVCKSNFIVFQCL
jgi:hypothetical protein